MPTGTRSSISANSTMKPMTATASLLEVHHSTGLIAPASATFSGWKISRYVRTAISSTADTSPSHASSANGQVGRRRSKVSTLSSTRQPHLVEQHRGLHADHEQQHQRGEDIDQPLAARPAAAQTRSTVMCVPR